MNTYLLTGPTCISFSGGRTSGYMLAKIIEAHGGQIPPDAHVIFANTGKERPETLDFAHECATRWGVRVRWVEWRLEKPRFREVTYETASRNGEPFAALIERKQALPNQDQRWCTVEMKILPAKRLMRSLGYDRWVNLVGLRADEAGRVANRKGKEPDPRYDLAFPLHAAGVTRADVLAWWARQPFDLRARESNCDLCFMKGQALRLATLQREPHLADWWAERERERDATFVSPKREPGGYAMMVKVARRITLPLFSDESEGVSCACTD